MTREAERYSEHDPRRRFLEGEPYDELTELAATLDRLLDRLAAGLRHEQQFSAEVSHELRNPLARISAEAELALRRERTPEHYRVALQAISRNAAQMRRTIDALLDAARLESDAPRGSSAVRDVAERAVDEARANADQHDLQVEVEVSAALHVGVDAAYAERVLAPLLENACNHARSRIRVTAVRANGSVVVAVRDDGPGVPAERRRADLPAGRARARRPGRRRRTRPRAGAPPGAGGRRRRQLCARARRRPVRGAPPGGLTSWPCRRRGDDVAGALNRRRGLRRAGWGVAARRLQREGRAGRVARRRPRRSASLTTPSRARRSRPCAL